MQILPQAVAARLRNGVSPESALLIGLMTPSLLVGMDHHMFGVALPDVRAAFGLDTDTAAWASMIYTLPFMTLMPLYGRLGDGLGKRRLLLAGLTLFLLGTVILFLSSTLTVYMIGRAIQGVGTAGFVPLGIAIITQGFAPDRRGKVMGTWNSIIPLSGLVFPYFGGLLVDAFSWRAIYPLIGVVGVIALFVVQRNIPNFDMRNVDPNFLRRFDWVGVGLLSSGLVTLLFFTSSRPITGVAGLQDWRLLALCLVFLIALIVWERRRDNPYLNLAIFANPTFTAASICAGLRMFLMSSSSFLMPLYLTDIHGLSASAIGISLALQAGMLFAISQAGGQLADRWGSRRPVLISLGGMVMILLALMLATATTPLWWIYTLCAAHGLAIGLSLAPLHRSSMQKVAAQEAGGAAGLYSMIRFAGQILGVAVAGVILQRELVQAVAPIAAYQYVFGLYVIVAILAMLSGAFLYEYEK